MKRISEYWKLRWVKNAVFFLLLLVVFFTDLPTWVSVQTRSLSLRSPDLEGAVVSDGPQVFVSDVELLDANGEHHLLSDFKGKPLFINFWASWCVPCLAEFPSLKDLEAQLGDDVEFLFITNEGQKGFEKYLRSREGRHGFYRQLTRLPAPLAHTAIPASFLIDTSGEVIFAKFGAADWGAEETVGEVKRLLAL